MRISYLQTDATYVYEKSAEETMILSALACLFHIPHILAPAISEVNAARHDVLFYRS